MITRGNDQMMQAEVKKIINSGQPYDDMADEITKLRNYALKECRKYNFLIQSASEYEQSILQSLLAEIGEEVSIEANFLCEFGFNLSIGHNVYINHDMVVLDCNEVTIGNNVYVGPRVGLYCANHAEDPMQRAAHSVYSKPIHIGDKVWLGAGVHVLPGVTIGENSIIGAGSVVTKNIPANVIAAGNPCKVIRPVKVTDKKSKTWKIDYE